VQKHQKDFPRQNLLERVILKTQTAEK